MDGGGLPAPSEMDMETAKKIVIHAGVSGTPKYNARMKANPKKATIGKAIPKRTPSKPGRPSLGSEAKTLSITIKVSASEKQLWEKQAKAAGMKLREFILHPLRNKAAKKDGK